MLFVYRGAFFNAGSLGLGVESRLWTLRPCKRRFAAAERFSVTVKTLALGPRVAEALTPRR
jgi:hypothetical protein